MTKRASRRTFLKLSAAAASVAAAKLAHAASGRDRITVIPDDASPLIRSEPAQWAFGKLRDAVTPAYLAENDTVAAAAIVVAPFGRPGEASTLRNQFHSAPSVFVAGINAPESFSLLPGQFRGTAPSLRTCVDTRGLVYGLLELADRVRLS